MATVCLLSAGPEDRRQFPRAREELEKMQDLAARDRFGAHRLTAHPGEADLILFVEHSTDAGSYFEAVRRHPVYREFPHKSYLFCSTDRIVPWLPGVYASVERSWYWPSWTRSGMYLGIREDDQLRYQPDAGERPYLYSFVGSSATHPVRRRLVRLRHPDALVIDTAVEGAPAADYRRRYAQSVAGSSFVLCPRGGGTATFRLFEAMMLGRAPVIISDQWVPPSGPAWEKFSLRVPEGGLDRLPSLLEEHRAQSAVMGEAAREAWLDWFSDTVAFHRIIDWCLELAGAAPARTGVRGHAPRLQMLRPYHGARWALRRLGHGDRWRIPRPAELGAAASRFRARRR